MQTRFARGPRGTNLRASSAFDFISTSTLRYEFERVALTIAGVISLVGADASGRSLCRRGHSKALPVGSLRINGMLFLHREEMTVTVLTHVFDGDDCCASSVLDTKALSHASINPWLTIRRVFRSGKQLLRDTCPKHQKRAARDQRGRHPGAHISVRRAHQEQRRKAPRPTSRTYLFRATSHERRGPSSRLWRGIGGGARPKLA